MLRYLTVVLAARSPFPLVQPTPTPDQTNDEGRELFLEFVHDRIVEEGIPETELALEARNDDTINRCGPGGNAAWRCSLEPDWGMICSYGTRRHCSPDLLPGCRGCLFNNVYF